MSIMSIKILEKFWRDFQKLLEKLSLYLETLEKFEKFLELK